MLPIVYAKNVIVDFITAIKIKIIINRLQR